MRAGANGTVEVLRELGLVFADPHDRLADRTGHAGSGALGVGCGSPIATTQADRARKFSDEDVTLGIGLRLSRVVLEGARLLDIFFDLREAATICGLGPLVEDLARVAEGRRVPRLSRHQVQHMELAARVLRGMPHALEIT